MASQLPDLSAEAKQRLPELWSRITEIVDSVHPIELLCQLSVMMMHSEEEFPDGEDHARWQVRIELIAWHVLHSFVQREYEEALIDGGVLTPLEECLDEFFEAFALSLIEPPSPDTETEVRDRLKFLMRSEALYVRGEGIPSQIENLAFGLYGPHGTWFRANLGFTIDDAFQIAEAFFELLASKFHQRKMESQELRDLQFKEYENLLASDPRTLDEELRAVREKVAAAGSHRAAEGYSMYHCFFRLRDALGINAEELTAQLVGKCTEDSIRRFLNRMSQELGTVVEQPDPIGFNPLAHRPLIRYGDLYYLPVAPAMYDALLSSFHFDIWRDKAYRGSYDKDRAEWLEQKALSCLRCLLPNANIYWSLTYGPKQARQELDGLVWFDNKLIFIEGKWKTLTLAARMGNVDALQTDLNKSITAAFSQAKRARDFVMTAPGPVTFVAASGEKCTVNSDQIKETYQVSLLGRGGFALLAANLPRLAPPTLFSDNEFPWAVSLTDLGVICDILEFPSQLFDYLRRRDTFVREKRSLIHDEWDLLGLYLDGRLDLSDPVFKGMQFMMFERADGRIDEYLRSTSDPSLPTVARPVRRIPPGLKAYMSVVDASDQPGRSDFVISLLSLSDEALHRLWECVEKVIAATRADNQLHSVFLQFQDVGFALVCTANEPHVMSQTLASYCLICKYRSRVPVFIGVGVDISLGAAPHAIAYLQGEWQYDAMLEKRATELSGREGTGDTQ